MSKFDSPLNNLRIASPCSQDWNAMVGDDRRRYCGECKLNVYNLSGMSKIEAENLVQNAEGRLCVRFYQRADGSVITQDCPVGWARIKQRAKVFVTAAASLVFSFFGAVGLQFALSKQEMMGDIGFRLPFITPTPERREIMGAIPISTPTPKQTPTPKATPKETPRVLMGKIASPKKETIQQVLMSDADTSKN